MLSCIFVSPTEKSEYQELESINLATVTGERGILTDHIPLVAELKEYSLVRLKTAKQTFNVKIGKHSFFQFQNNQGIILTQNYAASQQY